MPWLSPRCYAGRKQAALPSTTRWCMGSIWSRKFWTTSCCNIRCTAYGLQIMIFFWGIEIMILMSLVLVMPRAIVTLSRPACFVLVMIITLSGFWCAYDIERPGVETICGCITLIRHNRSMKCFCLFVWVCSIYILIARRWLWAIQPWSSALGVCKKIKEKKILCLIDLMMID